MTKRKSNRTRREAPEKGGEVYSKKLDRPKKRGGLQDVSQLVVQLVAATLITSVLILTIGFSFLRAPKMEGYGMLNSLNDGNRVIINKKKTIKRFSTVYFKVPNSRERSIRRVVGLPGDSVYVKADGLYINDKLVPERNLEEAIDQARSEQTPFTEDFTLQQITGTKAQTIPDDYYLMLGDNRPYSNDSRHYGLVSQKELIGVAQFK